MSMAIAAASAAYGALRLCQLLRCKLRSLTGRPRKVRCDSTSGWSRLFTEVVTLCASSSSYGPDGSSRDGSDRDASGHGRAHQDVGGRCIGYLDAVRRLLLERQRRRAASIVLGLHGLRFQGHSLANGEVLCFDVSAQHGPRRMPFEFLEERASGVARETATSEAGQPLVWHRCLTMIVSRPILLLLLLPLTSRRRIGSRVR